MDLIAKIKIVDRVDRSLVAEIGLEERLFTDAGWAGVRD
jgi:hypothetical protein